MRRILTSMAFLVGCCGLLPGCTTSPVGQGPIEFGPKMQANYDQYRQRVGPGAFVVGKRGSYYSYCTETDCVPGAISLAMQLCHRHGDTDCRLYDIGGRVVWRRDLPGPASGTAISTDVQTERDRNAAKVDCSRQLKDRLPAALNAQLAATLAVKDSQGGLDFLRPAGRGGGRRADSGALADRAEWRPADEAEIKSLADQLRPAVTPAAADAV